MQTFFLRISFFEKSEKNNKVMIHTSGVIINASNLESVKKDIAIN
ncbi:hypothetical protein B188_03120 [Candidatus Brocadiaceae bacterium B188]|jgi:hypothetical protein|nr:hypothetical protein B188_03120 [Candidatus Brocadiaceae bacterium B188]